MRASYLAAAVQQTKKIVVVPSTFDTLSESEASSLNAQSTEREMIILAPTTGTVTQITIAMRNTPAVTQTAQVSFYDGTNTTFPLLGQTTGAVVGSADTNYVFTFPPMAVVAGNAYTIGVVRVGASLGTMVVSISNANSLPPPSGVTILGGADFRFALDIA